jgi:hypothetical protein
VRLADWPKTPYLSDELTEWIGEHLATLGMEEIAIFAIEQGGEGYGRRVLVATEIGLLDYHYGPRDSSARFAMRGRLLPWQAVRGVDLRVETHQLWAREHENRWSLTMARPRFAMVTEDPVLGRALADFAKVAAIMAEPSGWPPPADEPVHHNLREPAPARPQDAPLPVDAAEGAPTAPRS